MKIVILLLLCAFSLNGVCAEGQTWYFVRHFEKQQGTDPELTNIGSARASQLAAYFADIPLSQIYSTDYRRTKQTAAPVADKLSLDVQLYDPRQLPELAKKLHTTSNVLVVGHSNTTPELITLMGGTTHVMSESDYGQLFLLQLTKGVIEEKTFAIATPQED